CVQSLEFPFTF
nr:immunoglobulin light chain junction region [Macaca mulatta]